MPTQELKTNTFRVEGISDFNSFSQYLGREPEIINSHIAAYGCPAYMLLKLTDQEAAMIKDNHYFNIS